MMERLWSTPPHTLGLVSPACRATSTYWTGDVAAATSAFFHFQRGVVRASVSLLPSMKRDDPRKRRRGKVMACDDYRRARLTEDIPAPALRLRSLVAPEAIPATLRVPAVCRFAARKCGQDSYTPDRSWELS